MSIYATFFNKTRKCYAIHFETIDLFFSYDTLIAVDTGKEKIRVRNTWGPTTGRHLNAMGIREWKIVNIDILNDAVTSALGEHALNEINNRIYPMETPPYDESQNSSNFGQSILRRFSDTTGNDSGPIDTDSQC